MALFQGNFEQAAEIIGSAYERDSTNPVIALVCGQSLAMNDNVSEANEIFSKLEKAEPESYFARLARFLRSALAGNKDEALSIVDLDLEDFATSDPEWSWTLAQGYSLIGATDEAVKWLSSAVESGFINYPFLATLDPLLENTRSHSQFGMLMSKTRRRWRAFEA